MAHGPLNADGWVVPEAARLVNGIVGFPVHLYWISAPVPVSCSIEFLYSVSGLFKDLLENANVIIIVIAEIKIGSNMFVQLRQYPFHGGVETHT